MGACLLSILPISDNHLAMPLKTPYILLYLHLSGYCCHIQLRRLPGDRAIEIVSEASRTDHGTGMEDEVRKPSSLWMSSSRKAGKVRQSDLQLRHKKQNVV